MTEYPARDVVRILRRVFPSRDRLDVALLNYYKRTGIVKPHGRKSAQHYLSDYYTTRDIIKLAALIEMKDRGITVKLGKAIVAGYVQQNGRWHYRCDSFDVSVSEDEMCRRVNAALCQVKLREMPQETEAA